MTLSVAFALALFAQVDCSNYHLLTRISPLLGENGLPPQSVWCRHLPVLGRTLLGWTVGAVVAAWLVRELLLQSVGVALMIISDAPRLYWLVACCLVSASVNLVFPSPAYRAT